MTKFYIGLELIPRRITVFGDDRGDGQALANSGYEFVAGPFDTQGEAIEMRDKFARILTYGN